MKRNSTGISVIIPVLNEENFIRQILLAVQSHSNKDSIKEILVVDGGSTDNTVALARECGAKVLMTSKGRARQMNRGACNASGNILYFLHADTFPPVDFDKHILNAVQKGFDAGCFRLKFDSSQPLLQFFSWFTRLNFRICRGGDQSLFITADTYTALDGFDESYKVYEDSEFIGRLYRQSSFKVLSPAVVTSTRRYREHGVLRLQYHFGMIHLKNYLGAGPEKLYSYYQRNISLNS